MKYIVVFFFSLALLPSQLLSQPAELMKEGNEAYIEGNYEEAVEAYKTIVDAGYESAALYYNLGNAYFKSNKVTHAILNYERAKLLAPNDEEIQFNLELANTYTIDKIEEIPELFLVSWFQSLVHLVKVDVWAYISIAAFILMLLAFVIYFFTKRYRIKRAGFWLAVVFLFISVVCYALAGIQKNEITQTDTAIIFSPTITLKSSPDKQSTDLFVLHEGTKVQVVDQVGEWREIKLSNGSKGWLKESDIERI